jgi:Domain of unknown function (DUF4160)
MAVISRFFGILIMMFYREHGRAHIHVKFSGDYAIIDVANGTVLSGKIPRPAMHLVREWLSIHRTEVLAAWTKAQRGENVGKIRPLT